MDPMLAAVMPTLAATVPLSHRDLGGAGLPPVLLLHGLLGSSRNWQTVGRELAAHRHVFALDLRNHGQSPHAQDVSYPAMAADVAAWMDTQGIPAAEFIGHSMGGKVAMLMACRDPARVSRLIVVDIAPREYEGKEGSAHRMEFKAMNALSLSTLASRAQAETELEPLVPDWATRKFLTTNLDRTDAGWQWVVNLPALTAGLAAIEANCLASTDRYDGPTLFVAGGKSGYIRELDRAAILLAFPQARIETIAASGHNPHIETRAEFVAAVTAAG